MFKSYVLVLGTEYSSTSTARPNTRRSRLITSRTSGKGNYKSINYKTIRNIVGCTKIKFMKWNILLKDVLYWNKHCIKIESNDNVYWLFNSFLLVFRKRKLSGGRCRMRWKMGQRWAEAVKEWERMLQHRNKLRQFHKLQKVTLLISTKKNYLYF